MNTKEFPALFIHLSRRNLLSFCGTWATPYYCLSCRKGKKKKKKKVYKFYCPSLLSLWPTTLGTGVLDHVDKRKVVIHHLDGKHDGDIVKAETTHTNIRVVFGVLDGSNEIIQGHHLFRIDVRNPHGRHQAIHVGRGALWAGRNVNLRWQCFALLQYGLMGF